MRALRALAIAAVLLTTGPAAAATPRVTPAPAVSAASQIFGDPALPGTPEATELAARGYVRQELLMSGAADVYGYDAKGVARVETAGVPYTTRLIVIRPRSAAKFSGSVQLNPFHPVNGQGVWSSVRDYVLAHGDAYVGVMVGGDATTRGNPAGQPPLSAPLVLPWFDPVRYGAICWPDEDGIRWDVFAQAARAVREPGAVLGPLKAERVYASGWSFTGSFLRTFINEGFHDRLRDARGRPLIDGYLIGISSLSFRSGYVPINAHTPNLEPDDPRRRNRPIDVPVIQLMSENEAITNREPQTPDSDGPARRTRLYEVPGLTHGSGGRTQSDVTGQQRARRTGGPPPAPPASACPFPNTDVDMSHFGQAALANLDRWVRTGAPPPRAPRMQADAGFRQVRDAQGNALGGLRPVQLDVPLARYGEPADGACAPRAGLGSPVIQMRRIPLSAETLRALYPGGAADYLAKFDARIEAMLREGWLLPADAASEKAQARIAARTAFGEQ